ncbi:MAG: hypothetical protein Q4E03_01430 [Trueperella sp.]|nr:hypothetical protein [Trueperella sp.]
MAKLKAQVAVPLAVLAALALVIALPLMRARPTPPAQPPANTGVVVLGMTGVPWELVGADTPNLLQFAQQAGVGNLVVKTFLTTTCPDGGWLTLNTGVRTASTDQQTACALTPPRVSGRQIVAEQWTQWQQLNAENGYQPQFGIFSRTLADAGKSTAAVGARAALALADADGTMSGQYREVKVGQSPATTAAALAAAYREVADADLVLVDLGAAFANSELPANTGLNAAFSGPSDIASLHERVKELDTNLGAVLANIDSSKAVLVASMADADEQTARLQYLALRDGSYPGMLYTASTRQAGLGQITDLQPTILGLLGLPEIPGTTGAPLWVESGISDSSASAEQRIAALTDTAARALYTRPAVGPFYIGFTVLAAVFISWAAMMRLRRPTTEISARTKLIGVTAAAVVVSLPAASFLANLVPWWRTAAPVPIFLALCALIALLLAALALVIGRQGGAPAAVIAAITAATIAIDAIYGSRLHSISVLGDQPQSGGRFYGISNAPFVIFALAMLLLTVYALKIVRQRGNIVAIVTLLAMAAIAIIVDGSPAIGADFGGPPPLIVGFAVLGLCLLGRRFTARFGALVAVAAGGVALLIAFLDWLRPAHVRTHLGMFFQSLIDGEAARVVARKATQLFTAVPWPVWIVALVVLIAVLFWWRLRAPRYGLSLRPSTDLGLGAVAGVVLVLTAFVINDSGLVIPFIGVVFGIPLWITAYWYQQISAPDVATQSNNSSAAN